VDNTNDWKTFEKFLIQGLKHFEVIDSKFTGKITLHLNDGNLCDIDRHEVGMRKILTKHSP
jgi:hypothetical protein